MPKHTLKGCCITTYVKLKQRLPSDSHHFPPLLRKCETGAADSCKPHQCFQVPPKTDRLNPKPQWKLKQKYRTTDVLPDLLSHFKSVQHPELLNKSVDILWLSNLAQALLFHCCLRGVQSQFRHILW